MQQRWVIVGSVVVLLVVGIVVAALVFSGDDDGDADGALTISDAWVRATTPTDEDAAGAVTGAFMLIENSANTDDTLVSAAVDAEIAAVVEIHETTLDENDVMMMRPVEGGIVIPAGETVELKPGDYHVMLIDVQRALTPGETVTLTLTFESGTAIPVEAEVREVGAMGNMDGVGSE